MFMYIHKRRYDYVTGNKLYYGMDKVTNPYQLFLHFFYMFSELFLLLHSFLFFLYSKFLRFFLSHKQRKPIRFNWLQSKSIDIYDEFFCVDTNEICCFLIVFILVDAYLESLFIICTPRIQIILFCEDMRAICIILEILGMSLNNIS